jgi:hypothetical protein
MTADPFSSASDAARNEPSGKRADAGSGSTDGFWMKNEGNSTAPATIYSGPYRECLFCRKFGGRPTNTGGGGAGGGLPM